MDKKPLVAITYGVIAVIVEILYQSFFSPSNIVVGVLLTLGGLLFLSRDFTGNLIFRFISFFILNILLAVIAFFACLNPYMGLVINLVVIFFVLYLYMNDFRQPTSLIFVFNYICMYITPIKSDLFIQRIVAIVLGVFIIIGLQLIFNKGRFKKESNIMMNNIINDLSLEIISILNDRYDINQSLKINKQARILILSIKDRDSYSIKNNKKELTRLNIAICLCRLNMIIARGVMNENNNDLKTRILFFENLKNQINNIDSFNKGKLSFDRLKAEFYKFEKIISDLKNVLIADECLYALKIFIESLNNFKSFEKTSIKKIYTTINIPSFNSIFKELKQNFTSKSLKFRYSLKFSVAISLTIFLLSFFNIKHSAWILLSISSVFQPYAEDTFIKGKKRFIGAILGFFIYFLAFSVLKLKIPYQLVFFIGLSGYFLFKDYSLKFTMMTIFSISLACLSTNNIIQISIIRFIFVIIGIIIALIFNKFFLPYKIFDSVMELKEKYKKITREILEKIESLKYNNSNKELSILLNLSIRRRRIENKLVDNVVVLDSVESLEIEKFVFLENIKISKEKSSYLKFYYLKHNKILK